MQSLFDMIFGTESHNKVNTDPGAIANSTTQYAQNQLANAYNQQIIKQYPLYRNTPRWVYNNMECSLKESAEMVFPDDEQAQLLFILKHGGV